jgi:hypothetical protein
MEPWRKGGDDFEMIKNPFLCCRRAATFTETRRRLLCLTVQQKHTDLVPWQTDSVLRQTSLCLLPATGTALKFQCIMFLRLIVWLIAPNLVNRRPSEYCKVILSLWQTSDVVGQRYSISWRACFKVRHSEYAKELGLCATFCFGESPCGSATLGRSSQCLGTLLYVSATKEMSAHCSANYTQITAL